MRFAATIIRPTFGRVLSVAVAVLCAAGLVGFVATGDWGGLVRYGWGLAFFAALAAALFWFPSVGVSEAEVTVRNIFRTTHVPWSAIDRVDTKYALTLYTDGRTITAWASPAPNRYAGRTTRTGDTVRASDALGSNPRPGDLLSTTSGAAAFLIRQHWDDLREAGTLDPSNTTVTVDTHVRTIVVLVTLAVATAAGILL
jgi:hypothetical protein